MSAADLLVRGAAVGVEATIVLDLWTLLLARVFGIASASWPMVGRGIGKMAHGRFRHEKMPQAAPVAGEALIGWGFHYAIGAAYGLVLLAGWGSDWFEAPTPMPPLLASWLLIVLPFFVMMPAMGSGIAGAKTQNPKLARLKSLVSHSVFGLGMYATGRLLA